MDDLLKIVRDAADQDFHVYGELGQESPDDIWYLGKDRSNQRLVALRLRRIGTLPDGRPDYDLEVARELDGSVAGQGQCHHCGASLRRWARFCTQCGKDLSDSENPSSPSGKAALLAEVKAASEGVYDVLGEMPWAGGTGTVYFAVEKATGRLMRLRLQQHGEAYELGETRVMMPLSDRLAATYVGEQQKPVIRSEHGIPAPQFTPEEKAQIAEAKVRTSALPGPTTSKEKVDGIERQRGAASNEIMIWRIAVVVLGLIVLGMLIFR